MRTKFINATLVGDFNAMDIPTAALATYVNERTSHTATVTDLTFRRRGWKKFLHSQMERDRPKVIGISANTLYMWSVKEVINELKRNYDVRIILGGYHPSIHPEETITLDGVDDICIGDGEFLLAEYLSRLEANESMEGVPGLWSKENGSIIRNSGGRFIEDLDSLPIIDWDLWEDLDLYFYFTGMLFFIGNRGCPYKCSYCDAHQIDGCVKGRYYRKRDPRTYARELEHQWRKYKDRDLRLADLFDPVFTLEKDWVLDFCDEYRATGIHNDFRFSIFSRIDNLDEEKIEVLGRSGCALLRVGVESGDDYIRQDIYKKKISSEKIREIFRLAKKNGIGFTAFYILGGPAETPETVQKTIDIAVELDANRSAFFIYKPFTEEGRSQIIEHGGFIDEEKLSRDVDNMAYGAVVGSEKLPPRLVERYHRKAYFVTFGRRLLRMIRRLKWRYFWRLLIYTLKARRYGLDFKYTMQYFHIYGYDNVDK